ncbi:YqhG family protein [Sporolactobacillus sp. STSJ-5]|uniref:YqhG family protein n=1 Tax=Sporolactobacillus sp. STSJ-5 TaxID=2965076 RepID=UPI002105A22B|nr:YqhG family protein [Sporolactobacillus sp. STSJ-5]MCQ2011321.1 YqhG family protein [Sporolactobacillus sp. STSJ-5]
MQQAEIRDFLIRFFSSSDCSLLPVQNQSQLKVKLTKQMDKLLMNRPFYWHYIEQIGADAETATLTFRFNDQSDEGEFIHFGSPRLHQIFNTAEQMGRYIRLYQVVSSQASPALEPWLGINMKISYQCDLKKDRLISIGLQMVNGTLIEGFQSMLGKLELIARLPDYCYTLSPLITVKSGIQRIERFIASELETEPFEWADQASERWKKDEDLLDAFYEQAEKKPERYNQEKKALEEQYKPRINVRLINAGLFYLQSSTFMPQFIKDR